jgi:hypothetical protein
MINLIELNRQRKYIEMKQALEAFKVEIKGWMKND